MLEAIQEFTEDINIPVTIGMWLFCVLVIWKFNIISYETMGWPLRLILTIVMLPIIAVIVKLMGDR